MIAAGPFELVAFGFHLQEVLPSELVRYIGRLEGRGVIRILDQLFVTKDLDGAIHCVDEIGTSGPEGCPPTLRHLLINGDHESEPDTNCSVETFVGWGIGLDLDWIEHLARSIEPNTSALLMIFEARWASDLHAAVAYAGGFPIAFGCLANETMLVMGDDLTAAAGATKSLERRAKVRSEAMLGALTGVRTSTSVAHVIRSLLDANLISDAEVDAVAAAFAADGIVTESSIARARELAELATDQIVLLGVEPDA
jgi:hypothetical protein